MRLTSHYTEAAPPAVEYRSPSVDRLLATIKVVFLILFYTLAASIASVFLLATLWPVAVPPTWMYLVMGCAVLAVPVVILWLFNRDEPKRVILRNGAVWLGGVLGGRTIPNASVDLVKVEPAPGASIDDVKVTIRYGWRESFIRLGALDGAECFETLCTLCDGAATVALDESYRPPPNAERRDRGRRELMREFGNRGRDSLAGALLFGGLCASALAASFVATNAVVVIAAQVLMIAAAALTGGAIWRFLKARRIVREIAALREEDDGAPSRARDG